MKIRPQTFIAGLTGKATPMNKIGAKGFYVRNAGGMWWSKKSVIVANLPYTIEDPTPAQMAVRVGFARAAASTRGMSVGERIRVMRESAGKFIQGAMDEFNARPLSEEELRERRAGYHTADQLEAMLVQHVRKKGRGTAREVSRGREYSYAMI